MQSLLELGAYFADAVKEALFGQTFLTLLTLLALGVVFQAIKVGYKHCMSDKAVSGSLASITIFIMNIAFAPIVFFVIGYVQNGYDLFGIPRLPNEIWSSLPFWVAGLFAVVLRDFADYWNHRAMHIKWLWPIHSLHHSDEEVNALTAYRVHILEVLFMKLSYVVIISWAGFSPEAAAFGAALLVVHNGYVHMDLDWDHGPFKLLLASPRFHRWHHANVPAAFGKNLANVMPVWDYAFGTYYNPGSCKEKMGADGVPHSDVVQLFLLPFTGWAALVKDAWANKKPDEDDLSAHHDDRKLQLSK